MVSKRSAGPISAPSRQPDTRIARSKWACVMRSLMPFAMNLTISRRKFGTIIAHRQAPNRISRGHIAYKRWKAQGLAWMQMVLEVLLVEECFIVQIWRPRRSEIICRSRQMVSKRGSPGSSWRQMIRWGCEVSMKRSWWSSLRLRPNVTHLWRSLNVRMPWASLASHSALMRTSLSKATCQTVIMVVGRASMRIGHLWPWLGPKSHSKAEWVPSNSAIKRAFLPIKSSIPLRVIC